MKNKFIAGFLGLLSLIFFYLTYNQYTHIQSAKEVYQALGAAAPTEIDISIIIYLILAIIAFIFSIKFFKKKANLN